MGRKHFKPEQIIKKLREAEVLFSNGGIGGASLSETGDQRCNVLPLA